MPEKEATRLDVHLADYRATIEKLSKLEDIVKQMETEVMGKDGTVARIERNTDSNGRTLTEMRADIHKLLEYQQGQEVEDARETQETQRSGERWKFWTAVVVALFALISAGIMAWLKYS